MKLTCDLCGGQLMVGSGGQTASCTVCGLLYSMERLREKLGAAPVPETEPPKQPVKVRISRKLPPVPRVTPAEAEIPELTPVTPVVEEDILYAVPLEAVFPDLIEVETPGEEPEEPVFPDTDGALSMEEDVPVEETLPVEEPIEISVEEIIPVEEPVVVSVEEIVEEPVMAPPTPRIPTSYWIPPMDPPAPVLFAMELKSVAFSTIRGTVLSGSVSRGSQLLLGNNLCTVISCRPAQLDPGSYAELTISNCPSRNALKKLVYVIGCTPELGQLPANALSYSSSPKAYITRILQAAFSDCQIEVTNASTAEQPVTFRFHRGGRKLLTVILCHSKRYNGEAVQAILAQGQQEGIPTLRFFEDFWNNREYIIGRIRKAL